MIKKNLLALLCLGLTFQLAFSQIITKSDPHALNKSTDFLKVGNLKIGITSRAGGAINSFFVPIAANSTTLFDIMGYQSERYGRLGQSSIRDEAHSEVYNPTQAGFWEEWGTPRTVQRKNLDGSSNTTNPRLLNVVSNPASLWYGDGKYDFIFNQSIVKDYYNFRNLTGDYFDSDNITEGTRGINQSEEITSEFNYGGTYEDYQARLGSTASAVMHHFEYAFKRNPTDNGNRNPAFSAMQQFTEAGGGYITDYKTTPHTQGNKVYQSSFIRTLNVGLGVSAFQGTDKDLNSVIAKWVMRWDDALFDPLYRYKQRLDGTWSAAENRTNNGFTGNAGNGYKTSVIVSYTADRNSPGRSIGFYRPSSSDNNSSIVAKRVSDNSILYRVNRQTEISVFDQKNSFDIGMSATGFDHRIKGILNPTRLNDFGGVTGRDVYENYVADYFIFYGDTPQEVMTAIAKVDNYLRNNNNTLSSQVASENVASSIDVANTISLSIFPNPATTLINFKLTNPKATNVNIFNQVGKLVYTKQNVAGNFSIPSAEIGGAGVYFIKTETETKQFIIAQ